MVCLQLLLVVTKSLHVFSKLLLVLLGELGGLLEFLVLRLVLFKDRDKLPFFLDAFDRLLLVLLDLVLNLLSLVVDLLIECLLDAHVLAILFVKLFAHEFHLLRALLLQLLVLELELIRLFPDHLIFLLRLSDVASHLRLDRLQVLIEVRANLLPFGRLFASNMSMTLLELSVLRLVLPRDLFILLPDDLGFGTAVLMLECHLVEQLLFSFSTGRCGVNGAQKRQEFIREDCVECRCALFRIHVLSITCTNLQLSYPSIQLQLQLLKTLGFLPILVWLAWLLLLLLRLGLVGWRDMVMGAEDVGSAGCVRAVLVQLK